VVHPSWVNRGETGKWSRGLRENFGRFFPELGLGNQKVIVTAQFPEKLVTTSFPGASSRFSEADAVWWEHFCLSGLTAS
jgi:hypothetical protein